MGSESRSKPSSNAPADGPSISPETQLKQEAEAAEMPNSSVNVSDAPPLPIGDVASDEMGTETVALRRRGRPRKSGDGPESSVAPMALAVVPPPGFTTPVEKRGRGRPKGSTNRTKQLIVSSADDSSAGEDFVPHMLSVRPGEDIVTKISFFSHEIGARSLCVISALGSVSSSICPSPAPQLCDCEIQALSGTYTFSKTRGVYHKQGMLSAALTMPGGEVIGGRVAGPLIASSLVQLVMGSFRQVNMKKLEKKLVAYQPSSMGGAVYVCISSPRSAPSNSNGEKDISGDADPFRRM